MQFSPERAPRAQYPGYIYKNAPINVYWETTQACDLACTHCRANAQSHRDPRELTTDDGKALLRDIKSMGSMVVLTGGDPMKRPDLFELIEYGRSIGVPIAITPSTTPSLSRDHVLRMKEMGVAALGLSIDGPTAAIHDGFRGIQGTFERSREALGWAREAHMPVQVNTTVTAETLPHLQDMYRLLREEASPPVRRWILFLLVPVGRGAVLRAPSPKDIERLFEWVYDTAKDAPFHVATIEAPHYRRYWIQRRLAEGATMEEIEAHGRHMGFGVRDGNGVVFVGHTGDVFPAGFLPSPRLGNVRDLPLSHLYRASPAMHVLRDMDALSGKCGRCEFRWTCGGSRARAFGMRGDAMATDPLCAYEPAAQGGVAFDAAE